MKILFAVVNILFLGFLAFKIWKAEEGVLQKVFWPALILKLIAGMALGVIYSRYYSAGDTFAYFADALKLADIARRDLPSFVKFLWFGDDSFPVWNNLNLLQSRALFMVKITSLVNLVSHDNYWISSLYFSSISFLAAWWFVKVIANLEPAIVWPAILALLMFPSTVFWSAGLIKESVAMASLYFLAAVFLKAWYRSRIKLWEYLLGMLSMWLLWRLKYYYLAVFIPLASVSLVMKLMSPAFQRIRGLYRVLIAIVVFIIPLVAISLSRPNFHPSRIAHVILVNHDAFELISASEDVIHYHDLQPTLGSLLINSPWALFSGLFRPLPWETGNIFQFLTSIENGFVLILAVAALRNASVFTQSRERMVVIATLLYCFALCVFLALSTPNFGTLVRYKVGFLPFFVLLILIRNPILKRLTGFIQR